MSTTMSYRYRHLRWPEVNQAVQEDRLVLIPAGTLEDHGPHLPIDTDVVIAEAVCERTAAQLATDVLLFPPITHGYSPHHIDFPGTVTVRWNTFVEHTTDLLRSLAYHGFRRFLIVNGHGSNRPLLDMATRLVMLEYPQIYCAMCSWWDLTAVKEAVAGFRESERNSHACELETSMYLAVHPERVRMDLAVRELGYMTPHFWSDLTGHQPYPEFRSPMNMNPYWSSVTESGITGDPTMATAQKGEVMLAAAAEELKLVISELRARPLRPRVDHHEPPRLPGQP
jgi:creatinine amidohydrolase